MTAAGLMQLAPSRNVSDLIFCTGTFLLEWGFLYFLYKKKVFLKV